MFAGYRKMHLSFFLFFLILLLPGYLVASPIQVESDRMESMEEKNAVIFTGRVVAQQGDLVVHSEQMVVHYLSDEEKAALPPGDERQLKKLYATGEVVKIETATWVGTGKRMDYYELERKMVLSGDAKVWQDNNLVSGEVVTMYLDEGRSIVERGGEGKRVRVYFQSGGSPLSQP